MSDPDSDADRRAWHRALAADGTGRGRRRRARAIGRPSAGSRRRRRHGGVPGPRRRADPGPGAAPCTCARGRSGQPPGRRVHHGSRPAGHRRRPGRSTSSSARESTCCAPSSRSSPAAAPTRPRSCWPPPAGSSRWTSRVARETYVDAFSAALFGARLNGSVGMAEVAAAARAAPRPPDAEPATADLLLDALVALADDYDTAVPRCREAVQRLSGEKASAKERLRWLWQGCVVALEIWDDEHATLAVALQRRDRPRDGDAQRARARPQRARADPGVLRRPRRRRRDGFRDRSRSRRRRASAPRRTAR